MGVRQATFHHISIASFAEINVSPISHTYRGDEHFLRKPDGEWQSSDQLIEGGGPEPLRPSTAGVRAVEKLLAH